MNPILRNILAIVVGWFIGSVVNYGLILTGHALMPIPGVDPNDMEALAAAMPTLSPEFMIFPFLAHALGTLVGAGIASKIAANHQLKFAMAIGALFFIGGIMASQMLPAPTWFVVLDLVAAYFPMAWIGYKLASKK